MDSAPIMHAILLLYKLSLMLSIGYLLAKLEFVKLDVRIKYM